MHETLPFRLVPDPLPSREALRSRTITALSTLLRPHPPHRLGNSTDGSQVPHLTLINSRAAYVPRANNPGPVVTRLSCPADTQKSAVSTS